MQHRLKRGRGFIIRNANREAAALRVAPVFEGDAHINDDAALAARLQWHRRHTSDAVHVLSPAPPPAPLAPASSHRPSITAPPPSHHHAERAAPGAPPALLPGILPLPPAQPPPTLVSEPKHLSHTATLRFTNTDISSVPYKTP